MTKAHTILNQYSISSKICLMLFMFTSYVFCQDLTKTIVHDIPNDEVVYFENSNRVHLNETVTAGTGETITLSGSNFGDIGEVYFRNANYGGAAYSRAFQIESWTDTEIIVRVPSFAGSGNVQIIKSDGTALTFQSITIPYALINGRHQEIESRVSHVGTYGFSVNLPNPARDLFTEAVEIVRCETKMNWDVLEFTDYDTNANDGINSIRFGGENELPLQVLAATYNRFIGCINNGQVDWFLDEIDIVINPNFNWNYDDTITSSEVDFLTVMIHELLHAAMQGHVIDESNIMHFSVRNGVINRGLIGDNLQGRTDQQTYSTTYEVCGEDIFTDPDCNTLGITDFEVPIEKPYKTEYYNILGQKTQGLNKGINIVIDYYQNLVTTKKVVK